jgi:mRNA-degrading endonuclease RelE of RelBE toxin-antitoxin system
MSWELRQTKRFARAYKKLHDNMAGEVDSAITEVSINPDVGDKKKGDLSALWVHRLRCQGQLYLLGYTRDDEIKLIWLEALGSHENFVSGHQAFIAG